MTTLTSFKVGDIIKLCASVDDLCATYQQGLFLLDQNISKDICTIKSGVRNCKQIEGIEVFFRFAEISGSAECNSCNPIREFHDIARVNSNISGITAVTYTVTQEDYVNFTSCITNGNQFKLLTCITNDLGQGTVTKGKCSDPLTLGSSISEPDGEYEIHLKYWEMPFRKNSADTIATGIKTLWNKNASKLTGWTFVSSTVDTKNKEVVIIANKTGSILIIALIVILIALIIGGIIFFSAQVIYRVNQELKNSYVKGSADTVKDAKTALGCDGTNPLGLTKTDLDTVCKVLTDYKPDPSKAPQITIDELITGMKDAVKFPTVTAPFIVITNSEFDITGTADPNITVDVYKDDQFSIWDIFRGDPLKFLDDKIATGTSDSNGSFLIKTKFDKQDTYRIYAKTGGKESQRSRIYALDLITIAAIIIIIGALTYYLYTKRGK